MKPYGIAKKTASRNDCRIGTHPDGCVCKWKKTNKKAARRFGKVQLGKED